MPKREIEFEMFQWLETKLAGNGLAQAALEQKDGRTLFRLAMESCVGLYETEGNNNGPMIRLIQKTIGEASREPWCMSLVQTCIAYAEEKVRLTSPVFVTEHCMTCWRETPYEHRVKKNPLPGAITIWRSGKSDAGHTGVLIESQWNSHFLSVEGNTGSDGGRDGDGVYFKRRNFFGDGSLNRIGWIKPF